MNQELVEITSEISLKQKLIEELETSQKRLHIMKQQYETKLLALEQRIVATQEERDKVLKNISGGGHSGQSSEKVNKVKQEYHEKLNKLQGEVKTKVQKYFAGNMNTFLLKACSLIFDKFVKMGTYNFNVGTTFCWYIGTFMKNLKTGLWCI